MKELYKSLAKFQQEVPVIYKDTTGYGYKYADLPQILGVINPLLKKHGLGFTQLMDGEYLQTIIFHVESGEEIESCAHIPQGVQLKGMNDFQVLGSAITYIRRYALSAALGLVTDKDTDASGDQIKSPQNAPKVFTLEDVNRAIEKGKQKDALKLIEEGKYTASEEFIKMLKK